MQSDLEFSSKQEVKDIVEIFVTNTDALQVHAEYSYQLPSSLQKLDEIKHNEPNVYRKITVCTNILNRIKAVSVFWNMFSSKSLELSACKMWGDDY